ncbi:LacI family transcriptional regulator [Puniceicoccales bacterium CK1056]|uniref:LacI family transcriptional regulator n=1 Tax=Oceanipulchritudo coccoides TaxID=2706888 RepID=A0A6B2M194_9BACT|nr:LacI family DNA-binding transcriptional regulator [Oceanipulchritudo coccoides]NDV61545.1 LacI family transcriptional regulator [Oceanipulchritudo coccoides]
MKVHLSDIAKKVGVSKMTVSRALREEPSVAETTRKKIQKAAEELGYVPNPKLARLMYEMAQSRGSPNVLGELAYITTDETEDSWRKYYHESGCYEGAKAEAQAYGYKLLPVWARSRRFGKGKLTSFLWSRGVDGIIIAPLGKEMIGKQLDIDWDKFCCVQIGATLSYPKLDLVRHNHYMGMAQSLAGLEDLGYKRIGLCISSVTDMRSYHRWTSAYLHWRTVRQFTKRTLPSHYYHSGNVDRRAFKEWLSRHKIEAIISMDSELMETCSKLGIKIPEDLGFSVLDKPGDESEIAGIDQIARQIGRKAVDDLIVSVRKGASGIPEHPIQTIVEGEWQEGNTVRRVGLPVDRQPTTELENIEGSF